MIDPIQVMTVEERGRGQAESKAHKAQRQKSRLSSLPFVLFRHRGLILALKRTQTKMAVSAFHFRRLLQKEVSDRIRVS